MFQIVGHVSYICGTCFTLWDMFYNVRNVSYYEILYSYCGTCFILWDMFHIVEHVSYSGTCFILVGPSLALPRFTNLKLTDVLQRYTYIIILQLLTGAGCC